MPWWLAGISFYLTGFSAFTFVAYSEMAYRFGFVARDPRLELCGGDARRDNFPGGAMAARPHHQPGRISGSPLTIPVLRQVLAWTGIPLKVIDDGLKIYATGVFVSVGMGYDLQHEHYRQRRW